MLSERVKVALHRIGDLVYVPHLLVLFETVKLLSGIGWWQIRRQELYGGCWTTSFKRVLLVGRFLDELVGRLVAYTTLWDGW